MRLDSYREIWEEWSFSARIDPFEHALSILAGFFSGLFIGASVVWVICG